MEYIYLDNNNLTNLNNINKIFPNLSYLSIKFNKFSKNEELNFIKQCKNLNEINIEGNPFKEININDYLLELNQYLEYIDGIEYNPIGSKEIEQKNKIINDLNNFKLYDYEEIQKLENDLDQEFKYYDIDDQLLTIQNSKKKDKPWEEILNLSDAYLEKFNILKDNYNNSSNIIAEVSNSKIKTKNYNEIFLTENLNTSNNNITIDTNDNASIVNKTTKKNFKIKKTSKRILSNFKMSNDININCNNLNKQNEEIKRLLKNNK